jgi:hypothetical protein
MIYGCQRDGYPDVLPIELREVTFSLDSKNLRQIAAFLCSCADLLEQDWFDKCSHRHISSEILGWDEQFSEMDIIVTKPD